MEAVGLKKTVGCFGKRTGSVLGRNMSAEEISSQRLFLGSKMILDAVKKSSGKQKYSI